jgi:outer membrane protein
LFAVAVPVDDDTARRRRSSSASIWIATTLVAALLALPAPGVAPRAVAQSQPGRAAVPPADTSRVALSTGIAANPDSALARELAAIQGAPLRLADAIDAAVNGSTTVRVAAADLAAARGSARKERGAFDPELFADFNHLESEQQAASIFAGTKTQQTFASGGARVTLPTGGRLSASLDAIRSDNNSSINTLRPQYDAAGRLTLRQPLLKGFGPGAWSERSAAGRDLEAAQARYSDAVSAVRAQAERTYWDLYAAERDLAVSRLIREQATALLSRAQFRSRAGLVGPNQVANAEVFLAEQEQAVLDREEDLDRVSDRLGSILGFRATGDVPRFRPVDEPPSEFPVEDQDALVGRALANNAELKARERDVAAARARYSGAKWNAYPQLDVFGTLGGAGLFGVPREVPFGDDTLRTTVPLGDLSDAISQASRRDFPSWSAGAQVTFPIGFRRDGGERDRLRAEADRAQTLLVSGQRELEEEVRAAHRDLVNASKRLDAARRGVTASIEQVRIGVLEYNYGRTTAFELARLGADLAAAQQRYSQALVRTAKAAAELRHLTSGGVPPVTRNEDGTE